ncbi:MAG TPA: VIT domain-containing protein [Candidatus Obscuribacterales bacterium]
MVHEIEKKQDRDKLESIYKASDLYSARNGDGAQGSGRYDKRSVLLGMGVATMLGLGAFAAGELVQTQFAPAPQPQAFVPPAIEQATKIPGLRRAESLITGIVDPESLTASYYWNFVVSNSTGSEQEAQIELALPDGAAVTRATLWINGVAQEAAFNETWKVERAYNWITKLHRDPLLVTQTSPGHILIKASPVMPGRKMQFRIGITAAGRMNGGQAEFSLPRIVSTNMSDLGSTNQIHIQSSAPVYSNNAGIQTLIGGDGYLSKGNVDRLDDLVLQANRSSSVNTFATRATHSFPPGYIVAGINGAGADQARLHLTKVIDRPSCRIIDDEATAHRLSTLWAYAEIERLWAAGRAGEAGQLANVYRIVSSVSGATVLETQSDYEHEVLDRNMYKSLSYLPNSADTSPQPAPQLQGATNGTIGLQGADATTISGVNTAGTVRVNNLSNLESALNLVGYAAGPVGPPAVNWLVASSRDANLFEDATPANPVADMMNQGPAGIAVAGVIILGVIISLIINFAGPLMMFGQAIRQTRNQPGRAGKTTAKAFLWLTAAICLPIVSQIIFITALIRRRFGSGRCKPAASCLHAYPCDIMKR